MLQIGQLNDMKSQQYHQKSWQSITAKQKDYMEHWLLPGRMYIMQFGQAMWPCTLYKIQIKNMKSHVMDRSAMSIFVY